MKQIKVQFTEAAYGFYKEQILKKLALRDTGCLPTTTQDELVAKIIGTIEVGKRVVEIKLKTEGNEGRK